NTVSDQSEGFGVEITYEKDGTKKKDTKPDCCNVDHCQFSQEVRGYYIKDGKEQVFSSGSGLIVKRDEYVDDGFSNGDDIDPARYRFKTTDTPGLRNQAATTQVEYYLQFRARVRDTTTGKVVAEKAGYWIKIEGKESRKLTHGGFDTN